MNLQRGDYKTGHLFDREVLLGVFRILRPRGVLEVKMPSMRNYNILYLFNNFLHRETISYPDLEILWFILFCSINRCGRYDWWTYLET